MSQRPSAPAVRLELSDPPAIVCSWDDESDEDVTRYFDARPRLFAAVATLIEAVEAEAIAAQAERAA